MFLCYIRYIIFSRNYPNVLWLYVLRSLPSHPPKQDQYKVVKNCSNLTKGGISGEQKYNILLTTLAVEAQGKLWAKYSLLN